MSASKRLARLNEQLKREIALLLHREVRDPRVVGVSVTGVRVSSDLAVARVFFRAAGGTARSDEALAGLRAAAPFLRRTLGRSLHVRRVPELRFEPDDSLEHARRIETLLSEVLPPAGTEEEEVESAGEASGPAEGAAGSAGGGGSGGEGEPAA